MTVVEVVNHLEQLAPSFLAEDFDNVGLLVGSLSNKINGVLVALDVTEEVVDEAISKKLDLIVTFHPIIFDGLKTIKSDANYVQRIVYKAIVNNINIYAIHTNLDNAQFGVNYQIGKKLGLKNYKTLIPKENTLLKLTTYIPKNKVKKIQKALFDVGAGKLGEYDSCSFLQDGTGTFKPLEKATPYLGKKNKLFEGIETKFSVVFAAHLEQKIVETLLLLHPYEEVAYEVVKLKNKNPYIGMGGIGELQKAITEEKFLQKIKEIFGIEAIKHSRFLNKKIKKIAFIGGSGAFGIKEAIKQQADAFLTADIKYHQFFEADNKLLLLDIGHYESEQYTKELIVTHLKEKINKFAVQVSTTRSNPVYYYK